MIRCLEIGFPQKLHGGVANYSKKLNILSIFEFATFESSSNLYAMSSSAKWDRINDRVNGGSQSRSSGNGLRFEIGKYGDFFVKQDVPPNAVQINAAPVRGGRSKPKDKKAPLYTEENFPFHRNITDLDSKTLFENICAEPDLGVRPERAQVEVLRTSSPERAQVEVKANDQRLVSMTLSKSAYDLGDKLIYFYTEHALIHSRIRGKRSPLENWLGRNRNKMPLPFDMVKARDDIWKRGEPSVFSAFLAKAVFDWFKPETVFDPCAGWGARAIGALAAKSVKCYVATDINEKLFETLPVGFGYQNLKRELDREDKLAFFNCSILDFDPTKSKPTVPNESGKIPEQYDMIFTSPPFYDFEIYNPKHAFVNGNIVEEQDRGERKLGTLSNSNELGDNTGQFKDANAVYPTYEDWQKKFYTPFCEKLYGLLKSDGVAILHVGSTWISPKLPEVTKAIMELTGFVFDYEFYFESSKKVPVLVFRKK